MEWSWKSHEFSIMAKLGPGVGPPIIAPWIREVSVEDEAPTTVVVGAGGVVLDRTDPAYVPGAGSMTVLARSLRQWIVLVTGSGVVRLGELDFILTIKAAAGLIDPPIIDVVEFAITKVGDSRSQGSADPSETVIDIQATKITRNGVSL